MGDLTRKYARARTFSGRTLPGQMVEYTATQAPPKPSGLPPGRMLREVPPEDREQLKRDYEEKWGWLEKGLMSLATIGSLTTVLIVVLRRMQKAKEELKGAGKEVAAATAKKKKVDNTQANKITRHMNHALMLVEMATRGIQGKREIPASVSRKLDDAHRGLKELMDGELSDWARLQDVKTGKKVMDGINAVLKDKFEPAVEEVEALKDMYTDMKQRYIEHTGKMSAYKKSVAAQGRHKLLPSLDKFKTLGEPEQELKMGLENIDELIAALSMEQRDNALVKERNKIQVDAMRIAALLSASKERDIGTFVGRTGQPGSPIDPPAIVSQYSNNIKSQNELIDKLQRRLSESKSLTCYKKRGYLLGRGMPGQMVEFM